MKTIFTFMLMATAIVAQANNTTVQPASIDSIQTAEFKSDLGQAVYTWGCIVTDTGKVTFLGSKEDCLTDVIKNIACRGVKFFPNCETAMRALFDAIYAKEATSAK